jgi:tricarballylate dehydrogenase
MSRETSCDVLVIGAGSAAFEAAISARTAGAGLVVMIEKAPEHEFGGNARFSHTGFRFVHNGADEVRQFVPDVDEQTYATMHIPSYTSEDFLSDLRRVTQGRIDETLAEAFVSRSNTAVHWLRAMGLRWELEKTIQVGDKRYFQPGINIHPVGGGLGLLLSLREIALNLGVEIRYDTKVSALLGNERSVHGVRVSSAQGEYEIHARATICCSGGFQASAEMRARYLGPNSDLVRVRGSKHNTGEVLQMLIALGAKAAGHWQGAHMTPIDSGAPPFETPLARGGKSNSMNRYNYPYGVTVNTLGLRFYDEGEAKHSYTYAKTGRAVLGQPGSAAFQIYDQTGIELFREGRNFPATMVEAETLGDLAEQIGVEPQVFLHTILEYNAACSAETPFDPSKLDGKRTHGLTVPKSNWAVPIERGPFRAYSITAGVTFTFGGVQVDGEARVINTSNLPIEGLFASGDVIGLFFHNYPSCTGQTRNAVFSYFAGRGAARAALA